MGRRSCSFASSASRASLNWFLRRLLISRPFRRSNRGPCALSHGRPSSTSPCNLGYGISYAGACLPAPCSRCRISPWPLRCSLRFGCFQPCGLALVAGYQGLQDGPVTRRLSLVVLLPCRPHLFAPAGGVGPHALLPYFLSLVGVYLALAGA